MNKDTWVKQCFLAVCWLILELTRWDIFPVDPDILVPVAPCMLMVEAQCVEELVLNDPMIKTTIHRQRNHLLTSISANSGPAPTSQWKTEWQVWIQAGWIPHYTDHYLYSALTQVHSQCSGSQTGHDEEQNEYRFSGGMFP